MCLVLTVIFSWGSYFLIEGVIYEETNSENFELVKVPDEIQNDGEYDLKLNEGYVVFYKEKDLGVKPKLISADKISFNKKTGLGTSPYLIKTTTVTKSKMNKLKILRLILVFSDNKNGDIEITYEAHIPPLA